MNIIEKHDLKISGYHNYAGDAQVDWRRVSEELEELFLHPDTTEFKEAIQFYINYPPMKQMIVNGSLKWENIEPNTDLLSDKILLYIRRVRNNLFHGGKFKGRYFADPERSETLIDYALIVLDRCLSVLPDVKQAYEE
jgi:hypothetical protein